MNGSGEVQPQGQFEMPAAPETQSDGAELQHDQALEKGAPDENRVGKQQPPPTVTLPADPPVAVAGTQTPLSPDPAKTIPNSGLTAKDSDKIERQWVDKAKAIIAKTLDDPFVQKNEMSKVKAEYIQKRYNKTIPVDGTVVK